MVATRGVSWLPGRFPGATWSPVAIDPVHPQILYAAGSFAIARSIDRGDTLGVTPENLTSCRVLVPRKHPG